MSGEILDLPAVFHREWEDVNTELYAGVRRMRVPGGWLYQTQIDMNDISAQTDCVTRYLTGWHAPIFVPEAP